MKPATNSSLFAQTNRETQETTPIKTLDELFGNIFEGSAGQSPIKVRQKSALVPAVDPRFVFELDDIRLLLMWDSAQTQYNRNLLITGPTGSGKTQSLFQFAARMHRDVFRYSCHERTDFSELLGTMVITPQGATEFQDGPLIQAMKTGGIFILDEVNAARPGTLIGMNGVLDGAESIFVPGSGEHVVRHSEFRIAATGNSTNRDTTSSAFRGTQTMNAAFMDRFMVLEKGYLDGVKEAHAINSFLMEATQSPRTNPNQIEVPVGLASALVAFATGVRKQFVEGQMEITVSTRGLFALCEQMAMRWPKITSAARPLDELVFCAKATLFNKGNETSRVAMGKLFTATLGKVSFGGKQSAFPALNTQHQDKVALQVMINPRRTVGSGGNNGGETKVAIWGYLTDHTTNRAKVFNGVFQDGGFKFGRGTEKSASDAALDAQDKSNRRGYSIVDVIDGVGSVELWESALKDELELRFTIVNDVNLASLLLAVKNRAES